MNTKIKTEERIRRLVSVIGKSTLPRRELIADLGLRQDARRNFRDNYLKPAIARGLVTMQYPETPSRPEQAYRLTANGLDLLDEISKKDQAEREIWFVFCSNGGKGRQNAKYFAYINIFL